MLRWCSIMISGGDRASGGYCTITARGVGRVAPVTPLSAGSEAMRFSARRRRLRRAPASPWKRAMQRLAMIVLALAAGGVVLRRLFCSHRTGAVCDQGYELP